jgi:hypothetical protein
MTVSWNTFSKIDRPTVLYGESPFALTNWATSDVSVTYNTSLTYNNHVKITGLKPDTWYYYLPTSLMKNDTSAGPYKFKTSKPAGDFDPYSIAVVVDMGTMGPEGLYTSAGKGVSPNNILAPGENNTIQSLTAAVHDFEFLWHRMFCFLKLSESLLIFYSWRPCLRGLLAKGGDPRIRTKHHN